MSTKYFDIIVIGCSSGGFETLCLVLPSLPENFGVPIVVVSHLSDDSGGLLTELLAKRCAMPVCEVKDKSRLMPGNIHVAPCGFHLLLEVDLSFSLNVDAKVCGARPSINVLFETVADAIGSRVIGVILTGSNNDGANGLRVISNAGGFGIVQNPETAYAAEMPSAAVTAGGASAVVPVSGIPSLLIDLVRCGRSILQKQEK